LLTDAQAVADDINANIGSAATNAAAAAASASAAAGSASSAATSATVAEDAKDAAEAAAASVDVPGAITNALLPINGMKVRPIPWVTGLNGATDLYTVPAGKRAWVPMLLRGSNTTGSAITATIQIKVAGIYYPIGAPVSIADSSAWLNFNSNAASANGIVLEAGESLALNSSAAGLEVRATVYEFPDTESFKSYKNLNLPVGTTVLQTVPSDKVWSFGMTHFGLVTSGITTLNFPSGGFAAAAAASVQVHAVANGGSATVANRVSNTSVASPGSAVIVSIPSMNEGEQLLVTTNLAGTVAWVNVFELDA
jgi:hypothetical protein